MNTWTEKSIELAYTDGYLDRILNIYPLKTNPNREMPFDDLEVPIREAHKNNDHVRLISLLNKGVKEYKLRFPIDCSYSGCIRDDAEWFDRNPRIIQEIGKLLLKMKVNRIIKNCIAPIKSSRQLGNAFKEWFRQKFSSNSSIHFLGETPSERKSKAGDLIGYDGEDKNIDLFLQISDIYIIGEAKFITRSGGNQRKSFNEALKISERYSRGSGVIPVSIIDGYCWHRSNTKMFNTIQESDDSQIIISTLLLEDFFSKINQNITFSGRDVENERLIDYV